MARKPGSDAISAFSISENDPSLLTLLGTPVWSRGEFPVSVAFNKAGDVLCALNTGSLNGIRLAASFDPLIVANTI